MPEGTNTIEIDDAEANDTGEGGATMSGFAWWGCRALLLCCCVSLIAGRDATGSAAEERAASEERTRNAERRADRSGPRNRLPDTTGVKILRNITYGKGGDQELKMDIAMPDPLPDRPMPAIIWIHGGGWRSQTRQLGVPILVPFAREGYFCASIDYRRSTQAIFPAQIEDCKCAVRFIRAHSSRYNVDPDRIGAWGSSAGGHLSALLGLTSHIEEFEGNGGWNDQSSRVRAVCDWFGPVDLVLMLDQPGRRDYSLPDSPISLLVGGPLAENKNKARRASPITYVTEDAAPFLIMHGTVDEAIAFSQSEMLRDALEKVGVPVTLVPLKGLNHGRKRFLRTPGTTTRVLEFFDQELKQ